jgi:prepilin-type N-terminal cleavage/methylation domain-containing protein
MKTHRHSRAAFSLIELLISLVIISILTSMVILIASQRAEEARQETAVADLRLIAAAQQQASIDIGYFLRLYVLDDVVGGTDGFTFPAATGDFDYLRDEEFNTRNPDGNLFGIRPDFGSLPSGQVSAQPGDLVDITALVRNESIIGIGLPYISYPRQWRDPADSTRNYNVPSDPWGMPYVILTRQGFFNDVDILFDPDVGLIDTLVIIDGDSYNPLVVDRMTLLSFGPNVLPGNGAGTTFGEDGTDDLFLQLN